MLTNLLSNAFKFTPDRGEITLALWKNESSYGFRIKDNGIGIPPEKLSRIFERFYQGARKEGSTGLGLALVSAVGRYYGLRIDYRFEGGRHRFSVRWP